MRPSSLTCYALAYHATLSLAAFRPDLRVNVQVAELEPHQKIPDGATEIPMKAYPGSDFEISFKCHDPAKQLTFSDCQTWVACCEPGHRLLGSEDTAFDCCCEGEELTGSKDNRYKCCPPDHEFDGKECVCTDGDGGDGKIKKKKKCPTGEILINGECICPTGTARASDGKCQAVECSSGLQTGKCYTFTFENGFRFGFNTAGFYTASEESRAQQFGKFMLCADENCTSCTDINPGDGFRIKDIHGQANGGANCKQWLNNAKDGDHIAKTPDYTKAGNFTITKWPCGKYCLSGLDAGVGPTCPTEMVGATFTTSDDQSCIPMTLTEVPCDIRAASNNCLWDNKADQCADYRACPAPVQVVTDNATVPSTDGPNPIKDDQVVLNATVNIEATASA